MGTILIYWGLNGKVPGERGGALGRVNNAEQCLGGGPERYDMVSPDTCWDSEGDGS